MQQKAKPGLEFRRKDYFFPRTQQEAGLQQAEWESREPALRAWGRDLLTAAGIVWLVVLGWIIASLLAGGL